MVDTSDKKMTTREAAEYLGLAEATLVTWRSTRREHIPYLKLGRRVLYRQRDLDDWMASRVIVSAEPA